MLRLPGHPDAQHRPTGRTGGAVYEFLFQRARVLPPPGPPCSRDAISSVCRDLSAPWARATWAATTMPSSWLRSTNWGCRRRSPFSGRLLKQAGYHTVALGKWHLGYEKHLLPPHHGFDYFLASLGGTIDYFYHNEPTGEPVLYENLTRVDRDGYFTDLITRRRRQLPAKTARGQADVSLSPVHCPKCAVSTPGP